LHINTQEKHPPPPKRAGATLRARCSQPLSTNQTPHPTTNVERQPSPIPGFPQRDEEIAGLLPQSPIVCPMIHRQCFPTSSKRLLSHQNRTHYRSTVHPLESPRTPNPHTMWAGLSLVVLLRKEVIQPHLPVRLPCYDFVPIADPTFDGSFPYGLGHRLRVLPTFMT
jgi:hypothetical protein